MCAWGCVCMYMHARVYGSGVKVSVWQLGFKMALDILALFYLPSPKELLETCHAPEP